MQSRKYILKYLRQDNRNNLIVKCSVGVVLAMLFIAILSSIGIPSVYASTYTTPCAKSDQHHVMIQGDTLNWLAYRFHLNMTDLITNVHNSNLALFLSGQVVCIPVQGFTIGTQVTQIDTTPHTKQVISTNLPKRAEPPVIVTPVATTPPVAVTPTPTAVTYSPTPTPTAAPVSGGGGSVTAIIEQIFGSYGAGAINVARCESGLNPSAYNPSGASGLFQILPSTWAGTSEAANSPFNAYDNAVAAHEIFVRDGYSWREWTCQP